MGLYVDVVVYKENSLINLNQLSSDQPVSMHTAAV